MDGDLGPNLTRYLIKSEEAIKGEASAASQKFWASEQSLPLASNPLQGQSINVFQKAEQEGGSSQGLPLSNPSFLSESPYVNN